MKRNIFYSEKHGDNTFDMIIGQNKDFHDFSLGEKFNEMIYPCKQEYFNVNKNVNISEDDFIHVIQNIFQYEDNKEEILNESIKDQNPFILNNINVINTSNFSSEMNIIIEENKITLFKVICPKPIFLFTPSKTDLIEGFGNNGLLSRKRIRCKSPRNRKDYDDFTRKKIKRKFINKYSIDALNKLLGNKYFEKLPKNFVGNVSKDANNKIVKLTLREIFENKDIYKGDKLGKYPRFMKVLNSLKKDKNWKIDKILNMKFCDLFEEYINSEEFKKFEINRLKKINKSNAYIERYIYLAKHLIEFFSE